MEWVGKGTKESDVEANARAIGWPIGEDTPSNRVSVFGPILQKWPHKWW